MRYRYIIPMTTILSPSPTHVFLVLKVGIKSMGFGHTVFRKMKFSSCSLFQSVRWGAVQRGEQSIKEGYRSFQWFFPLKYIKEKKKNTCSGRVLPVKTKQQCTINSGLYFGWELKREKDKDSLFCPQSQGLAVAPSTLSVLMLFITSLALSYSINLGFFYPHYFTIYLDYTQSSGQNFKNELLQFSRKNSSKYVICRYVCQKEGRHQK